MKGKILIIGRRTVVSREEKMKIQETTIIFSLLQLRSFNLKEYDFQKSMKFNIIGTERRSRESWYYIILLYDEFLICGIGNSGWFLVQTVSIILFIDKFDAHIIKDKHIYIIYKKIFFIHKVIKVKKKLFYLFAIKVLFAYI